MNCNCGNEINKNSKFCSECGEEIVYEKGAKLYKLPRMMTVKESHEIVFKKKLSMTKIYELIKTKSLPHVNAGGKILLDVDTTIKWWNDSLKESIKPVKFYGLKEII